MRKAVMLDEDLSPSNRISIIFSGSEFTRLLTEPTRGLRDRGRSDRPAQMPLQKHNVFKPA